MSTVQMQREEKTTAYVPGFDEQTFAQRSEGATAAVRAKREEAFRAYKDVALPTVKDEEWRRTDLSLFPFAQFKPLANLKKQAKASSHPWDAHFDAVITIDDQGYSIENGSKAISIVPLAEASDAMLKHFRGAALTHKNRKIETLNGAFWSVGFVVFVPKNTVVEKGVLIRYAHRAKNAVIVPRLLVIAEDQSEIAIVETFDTPDDVPFVSIGSREFYVGKNAQVKFASIQEAGRATLQLGEDWSRVERDGKIDWVTITLGGKVSKMMVGCDVGGPNANAYLSGLFFADEQQHFDQKSLQLHSSPDTYSNLLYKGVAKDQAHSIYQGIINAKPGAIRVDAYQMNNNLILNEGARADSLPGLEIDADDLKCSHGSTVGSLDPDQLFYLRSRGLSEVEAKRLVVTAFFEDVIAKISHAFVQDHVREKIQQKMK